MKLAPGETFPDLDRPDHTGRARRALRVPVRSRAPQAAAAGPAGGDRHGAHRPYRPTAFTLHPDLTIHATYDGYWYWGRPTMEDLRQDMRAISRAVREDFER